MWKQEGYDLMGAAFEVYNVLGFGMAEEIYQQSLEIELGLRGIPFLSKAMVNVAYKDHELSTKYCPDLLVFGEIVVELKAVKAMAAEHEAQLFNYLRISKKQVGYLINFGSAKELEWRRFVLSGRSGNTDPR
jgi:GxxExxY protein